MAKIGLLRHWSYSEGENHHQVTLQPDDQLAQYVGATLLVLAHRFDSSRHEPAPEVEP
jgi:hypothetical protein